MVANFRGYDPAEEAAKYYDKQEQAQLLYIHENRDSQLNDVAEWTEKLIKLAGPSFQKQTTRTFDEAVLLCVYLLDYVFMMSNDRLNLKYRLSQYGDPLFEVLEDFPKVDAIEDGVIETLSNRVTHVRCKLEEID